jgi:hypothetical protein
MDSSTAMPPPTSTQTTKVAASGPAVSTPLAFDQLALESPAIKHANKNGQRFIKFKYADRDGKIYECELPEAMSKGSYTVDEWGRTFNVYRLPQVVGHKKMKSRRPGQIGDFPFISPKPQQVAQPKPVAPAQTEPLPVTPQMPMPSSSAPSSSPAPMAPPARAPGP